MADERRDLLAETARAIHTLFYRDKAAANRYKAVEASLTNDDERLAFQRLSVGLIRMEPPSEAELEHMRRAFTEMQAREAERPTMPSERIAIRTNESDEGRYVERLLEKMYTYWQGTLDFERGVHRFCFYSPFDEELRRVTIFADVAVDGETTELQARSYILGPYLRVIDHRTKRESDEPWRVLQGDLSLILPDEEAAA